MRTRANDNQQVARPNASIEWAVKDLSYRFKLDQHQAVKSSFSRRGPYAIQPERPTDMTHFWFDLYIQRCMFFCCCRRSPALFFFFLRSFVSFITLVRHIGGRRLACIVLFIYKIYENRTEYFYFFRRSAMRCFVDFQFYFFHTLAVAAPIERRAAFLTVRNRFCLYGAPSGLELECVCVRKRERETQVCGRLLRMCIDIYWND